MSMSSLRVCKISTMHILVKFILPEAPEEEKNSHGITLDHESYEDIGQCINSDDNQTCDCSPNRTEGFLSAVLRDIEDASQDDHDPGDGVKDALNPGWDEIITVTVQDDTCCPMEVLNRFKARYPLYRYDLWETARNVGYDLEDISPPDNP